MIKAAYPAPPFSLSTELGAILSWFYLADRTSLLPRAGKLYSRDVFAFLCLAIAAAAAAGGTVAAKAPSLLNRHQTEEWKGWMQVSGREGGGGGVMGLMRA